MAYQHILSRTFNAISDSDKILEKLEEVSVELENDMRNEGWAGKTVTLKYKLDTYQGAASSIKALPPSLTNLCLVIQFLPERNLLIGGSHQKKIFSAYAQT